MSLQVAGWVIPPQHAILPESLLCVDNPVNAKQEKVLWKRPWFWLCKANLKFTKTADHQDFLETVGPTVLSWNRGFETTSRSNEKFCFQFARPRKAPRQKCQSSQSAGPNGRCATPLSEVWNCTPYPNKCHHGGYATKKPTEDLLLNFDPSAALTGTAPSFSVMKAQREARKA